MCDTVPIICCVVLKEPIEILHNKLISLTTWLALLFSIFLWFSTKTKLLTILYQIEVIPVIDYPPSFQHFL